MDYPTEQSIHLGRLGTMLWEQFAYTNAPYAGEEDVDEIEPKLELERFKDRSYPDHSESWGAAFVQSCDLSALRSKFGIEYSGPQLFWDQLLSMGVIHNDAAWPYLHPDEQRKITTVWQRMHQSTAVDKLVEAAKLQFGLSRQATVDKADVEKRRNPVMKVREPKYGEKGQLSGDYRADLLPPIALLQIAELLKKGAERHQDEDPSNPKWKSTPIREHVNRALTHILGHLAGDSQEEHLLHAACRLLFALEIDYSDGPFENDPSK